MARIIDPAGYVDHPAQASHLSLDSGQPAQHRVHCVNVLTQVAAVTKALAVKQGGPEADAKVDELPAAVERFARTR